MNIPPIQAFLDTNFVVFNTDISIRINQHCNALDKLLEEYQQTKWAFITAWNPYCKILSDNENAERMKQLKSKVNNYITFEGEGIGNDKNWTPERSLLILGIDKLEAINIGNEFEQYAIVFGTKNTKAELIILKNNNDEDISISDKFIQLSDQQKLSLFMKRTKSDEPTEYDELLQHWWLNRY